MKKIFFACLSVALLSFIIPSSNTSTMKPETIYQFKVTSLDGGTIDFATFKGKKILVVNTASKCGFTPQYAELEKLYAGHSKDLVIVGFPARNPEVTMKLKHSVPKIMVLLSLWPQRFL